MSDFTIRERILISLYDTEHRKSMTQRQLAENMGSTKGAVWFVLKELKEDKCVGSFRSWEGRGTPRRYFLTYRGKELANAPLRRMKCLGIGTVAELPKKRRGGV